MWFFYEPNRRDVFIDFILGTLVRIGTFIYMFLLQILFIIIFLINILLFFILNVNINHWYLALALSVFSFLVFYFLKRKLDFYFEPYVKKKYYDFKKASANQVLVSDYFPHQSKSIGRRRKGKDRFNTLYGHEQAKKFRAEDIEEIKQCRILLLNVVDFNNLDNLMLDENIYKEFQVVTFNKIERALFKYVDSIFKVEPYLFFKDYHLKKKDIFHFSEWVIKDFKQGRHLMEYLFDYIMIFMLLTYQNVYLYSNQNMYEDVDFKNQIIRRALPYGQKVEMLKSENKLNILHPRKCIVLKTETGVNENNLDKTAYKRALEDGSAHYLQVISHIVGKFRMRSTDQVEGRNLTFKREHDETTDPIEYVNDIPLATRRVAVLKRKLAIRKWLNFWLGFKFSLEKHTKNILMWQQHKYLEFKVYISPDGLKKTEKRLYFNKQEDLDVGGYIKCYAYAPHLYSLYNNRYMEKYGNYDEIEENYFDFEPYMDLDLTDELIELMGLNDLRKKS